MYVWCQLSMQSIEWVWIVIEDMFSNVFIDLGKGCGNDSCKCEKCTCAPGTCQCGKWMLICRSSWKTFQINLHLHWTVHKSSCSWRSAQLSGTVYLSPSVTDGQCKTRRVILLLMMNIRVVCVILGPARWCLHVRSLIRSISNEEKKQLILSASLSSDD